MRDGGIGRRFTHNGSSSLTGSDWQLFQLSCFIAHKRDAKLIRLRLGVYPITPSDEAFVTVRVTRNHSVTAGGGSPSFDPLNSTDATQGAISTTNSTDAGTSITGGTFDDLIEDAWNTRMPYDLNLAPDEAPYVDSSTQRFCVAIGASAIPGGTIKWTATFEVYE